MSRGEHTSLSKSSSGVARVDLRNRGLRMPQHTFAVRHAPRYLYPLFAAPLRPNETLVGLNVWARSYMDRMVKLTWHQPIEAELAVWKVPLSTIGDYFVDLLVADAEDMPFGSLAGSGVSSSPGAHDEHGPATQSPHHNRNRQWAGEIAWADVSTPTGIEASYTPYVSASVWHVARMYYELELLGGVGNEPLGVSRINDDLWQLPPRLGKLIRSATSSAVGAGTVPDDEDTTIDGVTDSIAQWAEQLSLMTRANLTYAEYLADFGVPASRVASMPEPIIVRRQRFDPMGSPQTIGYQAAQDGGVTFGDTDLLHGVGTFTPRDGLGAAVGWTVAYEQAGLQLIGTTFDVSRGRRIMIDEPSILLGTYCWWPYMTAEDGDFAHMFDMTRMTHGSHWGNPTGGIDEADFLSAQELRSLNGTAEATNDDGFTSPFAFNLLNLYLNGDAYSNGVLDFGYYQAFSNDFPEDVRVEDDQDVNTVGKAQLAVATDLVG